MRWMFVALLLSQAVWAQAPSGQRATHTSDGVPIRYVSPQAVHSGYYYGYGGYGGYATPLQTPLSSNRQAPPAKKGLPGYNSKPDPHYRYPVLGR